MTKQTQIDRLTRKLAKREAKVGRTRDKLNKLNGKGKKAAS